MTQQADVFDLIINTMAGSEIVVDGVSEDMTLGMLRNRVAESILQVPHFTVKLLAEGDMLEDSTLTLSALFSTYPDVSLLLMRCPGDREEHERLFSELRQAMQCRRLEEAKHLIDLGAGFDEEGNILIDRSCPAEGVPGNTLLHLAIREGLVDLTLYLLSRGVDINLPNDAGRSPLMQALLKKQKTVAEAILRLQPALETLDYLSKSALHYAMHGGVDSVAAQLLSFFTEQEILDSFGNCASSSVGSLHNAVCPMSANHPLILCCVREMPITAEALLQYDIFQRQINLPDLNGRTLLYHAHHFQLPTVVAALLSHGADPSVRDKFGRLPEDGSPKPEVVPKGTSGVFRNFVQCFAFRLGTKN